MSSKTTKYLLDASVLIEASKRYYAFDLVSTFWKELTSHARMGDIISIDKVKAEIHDKNKPLYDWASNQFEQWESTANEATEKEYRKLIQWSRLHSQYSETAKAEFASAEKADAWLLAHALAGRYAVVTEEAFNPDIRKRIPIPNACRAFHVPHLDTFQMLRQLGIRLA